MKLYLVSSILLLVPLVFATQQPVKILYSDGYVLTESTYGVVRYQRDDYFLNFQLNGHHWVGGPQQMRVWDRSVENMKDAKLSFVVETDGAQSPHGMGVVDHTFCKTNSSAELRPLIYRCSGLVLIRTMTPEERSQMEEFKASSEENDNNLNMLYGNERLVSKTVDLDDFTLHVLSASEPLSVAVYRAPDLRLNVMLEDYTDKRFVVKDQAEESNCENPPVDGLKVSVCYGDIEISKPSDDENGAPPKSLDDDLSPEELRNLLNIILARL